MDLTVTVDVIVVGGGMAGLTAAAYLSKAGLKVLLVEKEKKIGGLVNSFDYRGFVFDGGIRGIENSGIIFPMLKQLGIQVEFLKSPVSIGIGSQVIGVEAPESLDAYQEMLVKTYPESKQDIAGIVREIRKVMDYMDVLYGIDNPLFMDLTDLNYVRRTIMPWALKYALTLPKLTRLYQPVDEYLEGFSSNRSLLDIIEQHFFLKTPAYFALSYFSLYLDYRYPKGGTGSLPKALEQFILDHGGEIRTETEVTRLDPAQNELEDTAGRHYKYRKLVWAADLKTLYRSLNLTALAGTPAASKIEAQQAAFEGKTGGESIFTLYLTADLDKAYFAQRSNPHFFYTPSPQGLSHGSLDGLRTQQPQGWTGDWEQIAAALQRFVAFNTFEISIPVLRDAKLAPPGKTGLIISLLFDYSLAKHIADRGWYEAYKEWMADCMLDVLDGSIYPGLKAAVIDRFTSSPLTMQRITGNTDGAITGWAFTNPSIPAEHRLIRVANAVLTPIPNIYQAGQWTYSPAGLPISVLTGKLAADRAVKDLARGR